MSLRTLFCLGTRCWIQRPLCEKSWAGTGGLTGGWRGKVGEKDNPFSPVSPPSPISTVQLHLNFPADIYEAVSSRRSLSPQTYPVCLPLPLDCPVIIVSMQMRNPKLSGQMMDFAVLIPYFCHRFAVLLPPFFRTFSTVLPSFCRILLDWAGDRECPGSCHLPRNTFLLRLRTPSPPVSAP